MIKEFLERSNISVSSFVASVGIIYALSGCLGKIEDKYEIHVFSVFRDSYANLKFSRRSHRDILIIRNANNILTFISINFFNIEYAIRELQGIPAFLPSFRIVIS